MRQLLISLVLAGVALAADPPKLSDALLKERWKAMAIHEATAVQLLEVQARLVQTKVAYEKAVADLKAACGPRFHLDESGPEVVCVADPKK